MRDTEKGFTLIELLVVVGIIGVLAAIAIVNYMAALDKSKQKKTMADIRSVAGAWEARATDTGTYFSAGSEPGTPVFLWPSQQVTHNEMLELLYPTYIHPLVKYDGWGYELEFGVEPSPGGATIYAIRSPGKDGVFETAYDLKLTRRFDCDIVYSNGVFMVSPAQK